MNFRHIGLKSLIVKCMLCVSTWTISASLVADDFFQFSDTSISVLTGSGFELPGNQVSVITLENANSWIGGDFFGFIDFSKQHDHPANSYTWYGEFAPRFSLLKMGALNLEEGMVKDLSIATTWERGENGNESYLLGAGLGLDVPGFTFFNANLYARKDKSLGAGFDDMQITLAWRHSFNLGKYRLINNGFADYVFGWGSRAANLHLVPQLLFDAGEPVGKSGKYYLGLEIDYWNNQYGVENTAGLDTNQFAVSLIFKAHPF